MLSVRDSFRLNGLRWRAAIREHPHGFWVLIGALVLSVFSDAIAVWLKYHEFSFWRASLLIRGLTFVIAFGYLIYYRKTFQNYKPYIFLIPLALLSFTSLWFGYYYRALFGIFDYINSSVTMIRLMYFFVFYFFVRAVVKSEKEINGLAKTIDCVFIVYLFFIVLGALADIQWLANSTHTGRPGYKGIIIAQNEATGFIIVCVAWYFLRYRLRQLSVYWLITAVIAGFLVGNKGIYLGLPILLFLLLVYGDGFKQRAKSLVTVIMTGITVLTAIYLLSDAFKEIIHYFAKPIIRNLDSPANLIHFVLNGRDIKAAHQIGLVIEQAQWTPLLGGFPIRGSFAGVDIIDISMLFGVPFLLLYLGFYAKLFHPGSDASHIVRSHLATVFGIWMLLAFTAGHLLFSAYNAPFMAIYVAYANAVHVDKKNS